MEALDEKLGNHQSHYNSSSVGHECLCPIEQLRIKSNPSIVIHTFQCEGGATNLNHYILSHDASMAKNWPDEARDAVYHSSSNTEYEEVRVFVRAGSWTQSQVHHLKSDVTVVSNSWAPFSVMVPDASDQSNTFTGNAKVVCLNSLLWSKWWWHNVMAVE